MEKRELRSACTARENPTIKFVHRLNIFEAWVLHGQPKASIAAATYARKCSPVCCLSAGTFLAAEHPFERIKCSSTMEGRRVAVVGSGIAGLSAAWLLHRCGQPV